MNRPSALLARMFRSLSNRNYRRFYLGQLVSMVGMWMQQAAELWLVLRLTGSGVALGVTAALAFLPMLVLGPWGGVLADRYDKRRILLITQLAQAALAFVLAVLTVTDVIALWMIFVLALTNGLFQAVGNPTRRAFVFELVGADQISNAAGLWSSLMAVSRAIGPAIGGVLIATVGVASCFFINAASYAASIAALMMLDVAALYRVSRQSRRPGQLREGLRYAWHTRTVRLPLLMTAVVATLGLNFQVIFPLLADETFKRGPEIYGLMFALLSIGSLFGSLGTAIRSVVTERFVASTALLLGIAVIATSLAPTLGLVLISLVFTGAAASAFIASGNATLQVETKASMQGRVMALYSVVFLGSIPIGGPLIGWIAGEFGARVGFAVGGVTALATGAVALVWLRRLTELRAGVPPAIDVDAQGQGLVFGER